MVASLSTLLSSPKPIFSARDSVFSAYTCFFALPLLLLRSFLHARFCRLRMILLLPSTSHVLPFCLLRFASLRSLPLLCFS
ncbi:hypothetical protein SESBI_20991 [Sesbania bispinosa]|nr:hypothetical protein SESBI_20991 [Sesbania bispinosa]